MNTKEKIINKLEETKCRSAWGRARIQYAVEIIEALDKESIDEWYRSKAFERTCLNGAADWAEYSWGGCSLIYDKDIAERTCAPYELKLVDGGRKAPNKNESWLDVQARCLTQAFCQIKQICEELNR